MARSTRLAVVPLRLAMSMSVSPLRMVTRRGLVAFRRESDALRITDYMVSPDHRGRHLGVQLLGQAVKYARRQGLETLVLTCPDDLRGYFAQYGFESAGADMTMDLRLTIREIP